MFHCFIQVREKWLRQLRQEYLKETESASGWCGCETRLKFKIVNYRAKLSRCGCVEASGNAGKRSGEEPEKRKEVTAATSRNPAELKPCSPAHVFEAAEKTRQKKRSWRQRQCRWRCADEGLPLFVGCFCWAFPHLSVLCFFCSCFSQPFIYCQLLSPCSLIPFFLYNFSCQQAPRLESTEMEWLQLWLVFMCCWSSFSLSDYIIALQSVQALMSCPDISWNKSVEHSLILEHQPKTVTTMIPRASVCLTVNY